MTPTISRFTNRRNTQPLPGFPVAAPFAKGGYCCIKDQIPDFSSDGLRFQAYPIRPDFGIIFHFMENTKNGLSTNQLIYNI
jgi:hypothetical protein